MSKNIVVCCDGTSNQYGPEFTNVLWLYALLNRDPAVQATFYDPGVGTFSAQPMLTQAGTRAQRALGLAFGRGLTQNVHDAYRFIIQSYEPGDRLFLFGFSRGAYTVRVLAGMLHKVGLLYADNEHLIEYADRIYKYERDEAVAAGFKHTFCLECPVHFLGIWDTVSSVGWVWDPVTRPYTATNPGVAIVRHAVALDERRAFFKQNLWRGDGLDLKQVWFAGCHSDVGGANPLARIPLEWMLVEAGRQDLHLAWDAVLSLFADPEEPMHRANVVESLEGWWKLCEHFPKRTWNPRARESYLRRNLSRPRWIENDATVHESVIRKMNEEGYAPKTFPTQPRHEEWVRFKTWYEGRQKSGAGKEKGAKD